MERSFCFPEGMDSGLIHKNKSIRKNAKGMGVVRIKLITTMLCLMTICFWGQEALANESKKTNEFRYLPQKSMSIQELKNSLRKNKTIIKNLPQEPENVLVEIEDAAQFAAVVTGVRKDFLMGMLVVESDLGRNVGKCSYAQVELEVKRNYNSGLFGRSTWRTFQRRRAMMDGILSELGRDSKDTLVSCNPSGYLGTGGAMGIAQFMPDTWMEYKKRIADVVGKKNPDPWSVEDSVVAMALKLSDVAGVQNHLVWAEANAAKVYLSGTTSNRFNWYANKILFWSKNYRKLIV